MMFLITASHAGKPELDTQGELALSFGELLRHGCHTALAAWAEGAMPGDKLAFTCGQISIVAECVAAPVPV